MDTIVQISLEQTLQSMPSSYRYCQARDYGHCGEVFCIPNPFSIDMTRGKHPVLP